MLLTSARERKGQALKLPGFEYLRPSSVDEAASELARLASDEPRILAGGQTLLPAMALRMARPSHLIDINAIDSLGHLAVDDGALVVPAGVRHAAFHAPVVDGPLGAMLGDVVGHIAHLPIRNRGTFCGSLANADAASEWCLVCATLDARLVARSVRGEREIPADAFFLGFMTTSMEPDEMLVSARLPLLAPDTAWEFVEFSRRAGDFAQAMALVCWRMVDRRAVDVRIGIGGVEAAPRRIAAAQACLEGASPTPELLDEAARLAADEIEPAETEPLVIGYKKQLVRAAVRRALGQAADACRTKGP